MANITRYDPFGDLVDDIFRGFVVGPVGFEAAAPLRRMKVDVAEQNGEYKVLASCRESRRKTSRSTSTATKCRSLPSRAPSVMKRTANGCCTASATSARYRAL